MRTERVIDNSFAAHGAWVSRIRSVPGVHGVVPRLESYALITSGERTPGCQLIGTDLAAEHALSGIGGRLTEGKWMPDIEDQVYLTAGHAKRLFKWVMFSQNRNKPIWTDFRGCEVYPILWTENRCS